MSNQYGSRYRANRSKSIVYNVQKQDSGWRITASLPRSITPDDRSKVINWFRDYRANLRHTHPLWITSFKAGEQSYVLDVKPMANAKQLVESGQDLKDIWTNEVANRA